MSCSSIVPLSPDCLLNKSMSCSTFEGYCKVFENRCSHVFSFVLCPKVSLDMCIYNLRHAQTHTETHTHTHTHTHTITYVYLCIAVFRGHVLFLYCSSVGRKCPRTYGYTKRNNKHTQTKTQTHKTTTTTTSAHRLPVRVDLCSVEF